ncbi:MAG: GntR family transcriptional regulator [Planctomycetia bacterium]|nr:GntR family transcriptional regulator [Planctomycetia bacterium]
MVDTPSLKDRAYQHVRRKLADGTLRPTMKISLAAIAKEIGTSHIPVREAISQLRSEGYLEHTPSVGFFVRSVGRKEMADLFKVREALEVTAAAEAVARMTGETLARLEGIFRAMRAQARVIRDQGVEDWAGPKIRELTVLDQAFHATIVQAAGNDVLSRVISEQRVFAEVFGRAVKGPPTSLVWRLARVCRWHYRLLRAFQLRDVALARRAAEIHIREACEHVLACFDWLEQRHEDENPLIPWAASPEQLIQYVDRRYLNGGPETTEATGDVA